MKVREAIASDLETLTSFCFRLWSDSPADEHRKEMRALLAGEALSTLPLALFIAEEDGVALGFVEVGLRSHADGCDPIRPCGFIEGWFVEPAWRGRGVGRLLIARAEDWSRVQGCTEIASDTWYDNAPSQHAHAALGFEVVDRCVNYKKSLLVPVAQPSAPAVDAPSKTDRS